MAKRQFAIFQKAAAGQLAHTANCSSHFR